MLCRLPVYHYAGFVQAVAHDHSSRTSSGAPSLAPVGTWAALEITWDSGSRGGSAPDALPRPMRGLSQLAQPSTAGVAQPVMSQAGAEQPHEGSAPGYHLSGNSGPLPGSLSGEGLSGGTAATLSDAAGDTVAPLGTAAAPVYGSSGVVPPHGLYSGYDDRHVAAYDASGSERLGVAPGAGLTDGTVVAVKPLLPSGTLQDSVIVPGSLGGRGKPSVQLVKVRDTGR